MERKGEGGKGKRNKVRTKQPAQNPLDHAVKMERSNEQETPGI